MFAGLRRSLLSKVKRNDPCPCGSGKKFKHCHFGEDLAEEGEAAPRPSPVLPAILLTIVLVAAGAVGWSQGSVGSGITVLLAGLLLVGGFMVLRKPPPSNPSGGDPSSLNFGR